MSKCWCAAIYLIRNTVLPLNNMDEEADSKSLDILMTSRRFKSYFRSKDSETGVEFLTNTGTYFCDKTEFSSQKCSIHITQKLLTASQ
jgi:hypothetical protein